MEKEKLQKNRFLMPDISIWMCEPFAHKNEIKKTWRNFITFAPLIAMLASGKSALSVIFMRLRKANGFIQVRLKLARHLFTVAPPLIESQKSLLVVSLYSCMIHLFVICATLGLLDFKMSWILIMDSFPILITPSKKEKRTKNMKTFLCKIEEFWHFTIFYFGMQFLVNFRANLAGGLLLDYYPHVWYFVQKNVKMI